MADIIYLSDSLKTTEHQAIPNQSLYDSFDNLIPETFKNVNSYFKSMAQIISINATNCCDQANLIPEAYNAAVVDDNSLDRLAARYSLNFPINYDPEYKRFLLKYFPDFIKIKGSNDRILKILDLINQSESDFYSYIHDSYQNRYELSDGYAGNLIIAVRDSNDWSRLNSVLKFATTVIRRLIPIGTIIQIKEG